MTTAWIANESSHIEHVSNFQKRILDKVLGARYEVRKMGVCEAEQLLRTATQSDWGPFLHTH
jgi:hypothetical protein